VKEVFFDRFKGKVYQVMEFVEGIEILDDLAQTGSFTEERARGVFRQIVSAVEYLHSKNVCHRDIKPSNILVTEDLQRVVLVDFNVASEKELMYTR
jgi:serine/threonine protein kinase